MQGTRETWWIKSELSITWYINIWVSGTRWYSDQYIPMIMITMVPDTINPFLAHDSRHYMIEVPVYVCENVTDIKYHRDWFPMQLFDAVIVYENPTKHVRLTSLSLLKGDENAKSGRLCRGILVWWSVDIYWHGHGSQKKKQKWLDHSTPPSSLSCLLGTCIERSVSCKMRMHINFPNCDFRG